MSSMVVHINVLFPECTSNVIVLLAGCYFKVFIWELLI